MAPKTYGNRWETVGPAGEGGQSHVFEVKDKTGEVSVHCALKRLKNRDRIERFRREIDAYQNLDHPCIPKLIDYSLDDPAYFVTEFFDVPNLADEIDKSGPFASLKSLRVFSEICAIVAHAHEKGVFHRDLKPDNILLCDPNRVIILDFGLCYFEDQDGRLTETMEQVGARFYMAPELERGRCENVTPAADIYALGKIMYFLLTGRNIARERYVGVDDLSRITGNEQLQYVTLRILRRSILEQPDQRASAKELSEEAIAIHRLIEEHFYPGKQGSRCRFCGEGHYASVQSQRNFQLESTARDAIIGMEAFFCDKCGHIQFFKKS